MSLETTSGENSLHRSGKESCCHCVVGIADASPYTNDVLDTDLELVVNGQQAGAGHFAFGGQQL